MLSVRKCPIIYLFVIVYSLFSGFNPSILNNYL